MKNITVLLIIRRIIKKFKLKIVEKVIIIRILLSYVNNQISNKW